LNWKQNILFRIFGLSRPYLFWHVLIGILTILSSILGLGTVESIRRISDAAISRDLLSLQYGLIVGLSSIILMLLMDWGRTYVSSRLEMASTTQLQVRILQKIGYAKMSELEKYHSGDLVTRVMDSAAAAQSGVNVHSQQVAVYLLQFVAILSYLVYLNPLLSLGMLAISILLPVLFQPLAKPMHQAYHDRWIYHTDLTTFVQDSMQGSEVVRTYRLVNHFMEVMRLKFVHIVSTAKKAVALESILHVSHFFTLIVGALFVLGYGGYLVHLKAMSMGSLVAFMVCFERLVLPLQGLATTWPKLQQSIAAASRVFEILDLPEETAESDQTCPQLDSSHPDVSIVFSDVRYTREQNEILKGVTFHAPSRRKTVIVGPSGSGKTTIFKLLLRFYEPTSGSITMGGMPLETSDIHSWRSLFSYVPQDPYLFSGTIYENILLGHPKATFSDVQQAAMLAYAHEFIEKLPNQYDTLIGENGAGLSGGQKQRIAIARAILSDAPILLMDEPTSALDRETERRVQHSLHQLSKEKTIILITHRYSAITSTDHIVFVEHGRVIEEGTHESLMSLKGRYYSEYHAQMLQSVER
jgi:ATP-binding cassette subfamily B protein AbcA/BmrA